MINKESLGLFIKNNGPDEGIYEDFSSSQLYLNCDLPVRHFTNWDAGLSSLEKTDVNNVQGFGADTYPGMRNQITDMKTIDDLAFVAYGDYTDLNKSVTTIQTTGKSYYYFNQVTQYDYTNRFFATDGLIYLPDLDFSGILYPYSERPINESLEFFPSVEFHGPVGLFLKVEYESVAYDWFLQSSTELNDMRSQFSGLPGKSQFVSYNSMYYDINYINKVNLNPFVYGKFKYLAFNPNLPFYNTDATYLNYGQFPYFGTNIQYEMTFNLKLTLIKYTPVYNCGKVDLYKRKRGEINSISNDGKIICIGHPLESGDVIKITETKYPALHGLKYVQVVNNDEFIIYEDENFTRRTDVSGINTTARWSCISNIYGNDLGRWKYKQSIFSPSGRNRYGSYTVSTGNIAIPSDPEFSRDKLIPSSVNEATGYEQIFNLDYDTSISSLSVSPLVNNKSKYIDVNRGIIPLGFQSAIDDWRLNRRSFLTNFRFGCSIDVKKYNGEYYLLAGERGPQTCLHLDSINLPLNQLCGQAYLFKINQELNIEHLNTFYAAKNDSEIANPPIPPDFYCGPERLFIYRPFEFESEIDGVLGNYTRLIEYKQGFEYWYGAMCLHMYNPENRYNEYIPGYYNYNVLDSSIADSPFAYNSLSVRTKYFSGQPLTYGINRFISTDISSINFSRIEERFRYNELYPSVTGAYQKISYYPYVDSFGKSVALDIIDGDIFAICSSKVKPYVIRPEANLNSVSRTSDPAPNYTGVTSQISSTSTGYIHVFKNGEKVQKIKEDGQVVPGLLYAVQSDRAEKFAKTMIAENGNLIFGFSKPFGNEPFISERSRILFYKNNGNNYAISNVIQNRDHRDIQIFNPLKIILPDHKDYWITGRNLSSPISDTRLAIPYYQPSDKFGDHFVYLNGLLIANAYSIENEYAEIQQGQTTITVDSTLDEYFESLNYIDQLFVYDDFSYKGRIVPNIDSSDAQYSFESLSPLYGKTIKEYYTNDNMALDIDLAGKYIIYGDRLILRDPLSFNIYNKTASSKLNEFYERIFRKKTLPIPASNNQKFYNLNSAISILRPISPALNDDRNGTIDGTYSDALDILSVDEQSYSYEIQNMEYLSLFIKNDNNTPSIDLFVKTIENSISDANLSIIGFSPSQLNLFILGDEPKLSSANTTLFIPGGLQSDAGLELFINNEPVGQAPLYIEGPIIELNSNDANLYIYGSTLESVLVGSGSDLYTSGTLSAENSSSMPLMINTAGGNIGESAPLYIANIVYDNSNTRDLYIDGSITGNKYIDVAAPLFIRSSETISDNAPLFIKQFGIIGEPVIESTSLFVMNQVSESGAHIFLRSENTQDLGINLCILDAVDIKEISANCFIRGYIQ